jgi:hypothetical protein
MASGANVSRRVEDDEESIKAEIEGAANSSGGLDAFARHSNVDATEIVASGALFMDEVLRPGETINRTIIFFVPVGAYDLLEVSTHIPSVAIPGIELQWELDEDLSFKSRLFRLDNYSDKDIEYQIAESRSSISLWR